MVNNYIVVLYSDSNYTYYGEHFLMYIIVQPLCCTTDNSVDQYASTKNKTKHKYPLAMTLKTMNPSSKLLDALQILPPAELFSRGRAVATHTTRPPVGNWDSAEGFTKGLCAFRTDQQPSGAPGAREGKSIWTHPLER